MAMQWYVIQAYSGFEKNVQKILKERILREDMGSYFGQILVPVEEVVDVKNGKKTFSERKFFPGYVLIEMELTDSSWHLVKSIPRVNGFVGGTAHRPIPVSQKEVDNILSKISGGDVGEKSVRPKPRISFEVGEQVRIVNGPFADFNGLVEFVDCEKNKVRVVVQIFGRETPVELDFSQVEKS